METLEQRLPLASFVVMTSGDSNVNTGPFPGAGTAVDPFQAPTLREAILAANKTPGVADTITFAAALSGVPITLTLQNAGGVNEDVGLTGDLDVTDSLTIVGLGPSNTIIQAGVDAASGIDKVFSINPGFNQQVSFSLTGVTVQFGRNVQSAAPANLGAGLDFQGTGAGSLSISNCVFTQNNNINGTGGAISITEFPNAQGNISITDTAITNNSSAATGGGINFIEAAGAQSTPLMIKNDVITGNHSAGTGGGINVAGQQAQITITNSTVSNNATSGAGSVDGSGGGLSVNLAQLGSLTIGTSTILGNQAAGFGGGVSVSGRQTVTIANSAIVGNSSLINGANSSQGGGLFSQNNAGSTTTLTNVFIANNHADGGNAALGGGVVNASAGVLQIVNSTISANSSAGDGGGVVANGGQVTLTNVTLSENIADSDNSGTGIGGGIKTGAGLSINLANTIVDGNFHGTGAASTVDEISGTANANSSLVGNTTGAVIPVMATNVLNVSARLDVLSGNGGPSIGPSGFQSVLKTYALLAGSPALDAGDNSVVVALGLTTDERGTGFSRILDAADADTIQVVDMGAFEAHPSIEAIPNKTMNENGTLIFDFNVGDANPTTTPAISSVGVVSSSNTTLLPVLPANITISGNGSTRTLTIHPAQDQFGTTTITLAVKAGTQTMSDAFTLTVNAVAHTPSVTNAVTYANTQSSSGLVITPNAADAGVVKFFQITGITSGTLFQNDGVTPINDGDFITVPDGGAGLKFTPNANFVGTGHFTAQASTSNNSAGLGGGTVTADIAVIQPTVTVAATTPVVGEDSGTNLVFTFTRTDDPSQTLTVNFSVGGTATFNSDYIIGAGSADTNITGPTGTVTFAPGHSTAIVNLTPQSDNLVEGDETIQFTITTQPSYTTTTPPSSGTGTIQDADAATVSFQSASSTAGEDSGAHDVIAMLTTAAGNTLASAATFNVTATNGTAGNADYDSGAFPKTITFAAGSANAAQQTVNITPTPDNLVEGDETVTLALAVSSGIATVGAQSTHVVTIQDADTATVAFQSASSTTGEDAGAHGVVAVLTTAPGNTLASSTTFSVTVANGLTSNTDFDSGAFPKTISFAAGSGNGAQRTVNITPTPDNLVEGDEDLTLTLTATSGPAAVGAQSTHQVTIQDADNATIVIVAGQTVNEDGGSQPINVRITMAANLRLERPLSVDVSAEPAAGTEVTDATFGVIGNVTFQPTDSPGTTHSVSLTPTPDTFVEGNEDVVVTPIGNTLNGHVSYTASNVTILDADTATVAFVSATQSIDEESAVPLTITVQLLIAGNTLENDAQFNITIASLGTATAADFDAASFPKLITFPAGSGDGTTQTVTLDPTSDNLSEGDESLTLGLAKVSGASTVAVTSAGNKTEAVTIVDDDIDLKITNVDSVDPVVPGSGPGNLTYTLTAFNVGLTKATGITVSEDLAFPPGVTIVSITPSGTTTYDPPNAAHGKWLISSLAAGSSEKLTIVLTVTAGTAPGVDVISSAAAIAVTNGNRINQGDDAATQKTSVAANSLDFGDAPNSYGTLLANNGARHHISPLFLGASVDAEVNGQPNATATGDDSAGIDDENGVTMPSFLVPGLDASITVIASAAGKLDAWVDFKRNGVFDAVDRVFASFAVAAGSNTLKFTVPSTAVTGTTFARFRLSSAGGLGPVGEAADGEVEDYAVKVMATAPDSAVLIDDPAAPGKKVLVLTGTSKNDNFVLQLKSGALLCKHGCKINTYSLAQIGSIVLLGNGGNDTVSLPISLAIPMQLIGQWKVNKTK